MRMQAHHPHSNSLFCPAWVKDLRRFSNKSLSQASTLHITVWKFKPKPVTFLFPHTHTQKKEVVDSCFLKYAINILPHTTSTVHSSSFSTDVPSPPEETSHTELRCEVSALNDAGSKYGWCQKVHSERKGQREQKKSPFHMTRGCGFSNPVMTDVHQRQGWWAAP